MNNIKIVTKLDFRALKYCNLFIMKYKRNMLLKTILLFILPVIVIVLDLVEYHFYYASALSAVYIAWMVYSLLTVETRLDRDLARYFANRRVMTQTLEIREDEILLHYDEKNEPIRFDWSFITEIMEMPQYFLLMAGRSPIINDRSDEAVIDGNQADLTAIVREQAKTKPYKKIEHDIVKKPITFVHPEFPEPEVTEADTESKEVENVVIEDDTEEKAAETKEEAAEVPSENGEEQ